ncbi:PATATIN-like protein 5 [Striga asiatica]|uniref:PATATIN-like protein 5 n=1 Tax=Striga asiatica TaxID=4170 RepID=A0A5A7R2K2_STRAF|nr:PATATIN-like protein 5 [Striga asiatica]
MNLFTLEEATILLPDADNDELPPVKTLFPENITRINKKQMQKRVIVMNPNSNQAPEARSEQKNPNSNKKFKRHGQFFTGEKLQRNGEVEQSRRGRAEPARSCGAGEVATGRCRKSCGADEVVCGDQRSCGG